MPSARVWSLAAVAGAVVFVWSLLSAGVNYDERRVRVETITAALSKAPDDIVAWNNLASLIVAADDADAEFDRWRRRAPKSLIEDEAGDAMLLYRVAARLNDAEADAAFKQTIEILERFTRERPERAAYYHWHTLMHAYRQTEQPDKALAAAERTEALATLRLRDNPSPNLATALYWLGLSRHQLGDAAGGRRGWALLVRLMDQLGEMRDQGRQYNWDDLSRIALRVGDKATAAECLERYEAQLRERSAARDRPQLWSQLGWRWREAGREEDAVRVWRHLASFQQTLADLNPDDAAVFYNLACFRALAGQTAEALDAWDAALALGWRRPGHSNSDADLDSIRSEPRFIRGMIAMTHRALEEGRPAPEGRADLLRILSRYQVASGDVDEGLDTLKQAVDAGFLDARTLRRDPFFEPIAADPRFVSLISEIERRRHEALRDARPQRQEGDEGGASPL